jgi:hypothetical protein
VSAQRGGSRGMVELVALFLERRGEVVGAAVTAVGFGR